MEEWPHKLQLFNTLSGRRLVGSAVPPASKLACLLERCPNLRVMSSSHARALAKRLAVGSDKKRGGSASTGARGGKDQHHEAQARRLATVASGGRLGDAPALGKMLLTAAPTLAGADPWEHLYRELAAFCAARRRLPQLADFNAICGHDARLGPEQRELARELFEWVARNRALESAGQLGREQRAQLAALGVFGGNGSQQEEEGEAFVGEGGEMSRLWSRNSGVENGVEN